jgi:hypothetical protein
LTLLMEVVGLREQLKMFLVSKSLQKMKNRNQN